MGSTYGGDMDVYPSLTYRDVDTALEFLIAAFGLETASVGRDDNGTVRWAELAHGEGRVLVQPDVPDQMHGSHLGRAWVYLTVADPDTHHERARDAGAEIVGKPHGSAEEGQRGYSARDPEGNLWSFGTDRPGA